MVKSSFRALHLQRSDDNLKNLIPVDQGSFSPSIHCAVPSEDPKDEEEDRQAKFEE